MSSCEKESSHKKGKMGLFEELLDKYTAWQVHLYFQRKEAEGCTGQSKTIYSLLNSSTEGIIQCCYLQATETINKNFTVPETFNLAYCKKFSTPTQFCRIHS
jgi:hypothetical protein